MPGRADNSLTQADIVFYSALAFSQPAWCAEGAISFANPDMAVWICFIFLKYGVESENW